MRAHGGVEAIAAPRAIRAASCCARPPTRRPSLRDASAQPDGVGDAVAECRRVPLAVARRGGRDAHWPPGNEAGGRLSGSRLRAGATGRALPLEGALLGAGPANSAACRRPRPQAPDEPCSAPAWLRGGKAQTEGAKLGRTRARQRGVAHQPAGAVWRTSSPPPRHTHTHILPCLSQSSSRRLLFVRRSCDCRLAIGHSLSHSFFAPAHFKKIYLMRDDESERVGSGAARISVSS